MSCKSVYGPLLACLGLALAVPTQAAIPAGFSDVVVFGENDVSLEREVGVEDGDVVANTGGSTLSLGQKAEVAGSLSGDSVVIERQATVGGDVSFNQLDNDGTVEGNLVTPLALPVFSPLPLFFTGPSDGPDVTVRANGSETLAPGTYGDVLVGNRATLVLTGGVYDLRSIEMEGTRNAILFAGPAEVRVAQFVLTASDAEIGPEEGSGVTAAEIVFYVAGSGEAFRTGPSNTLAINVFAPNGSLRLQHSSSATGAFLAREIQVDRAVRLTLDSFFFNRPPVAADDAATTLEDTPVTIDVLANDSDPNQDDLSVSSTAGAGNGVVTLNPDGTVTYTPGADFNGSDSFTYEVCDDGVEPGPLCSTATVSVAVTPVNDPPSFTAGPDQATTDDAGSQTVPGWATDISAGPADESGQALTFLVSADTPGLFSAQPAVSADGTLTYTPANGADGVATVSVQLMDDGGTADGGVDKSGIATFTISIDGINTPPDAVDDSATTPEDTPVTIDVLANDSDSDGNLVPSSVTVVGAPALGDTSVDTATGAVTYTPRPGVNGTDVFTYQVCDDGSPLPAECDTATVTVTVTPVNEDPVAFPDDVFNADASVDITLVGADGDGDGLTFSILSGPTAGSLGAITQLTPTSASVTYTPTTPGGTDAFTFQVDDGNGGTDSAQVDINPPPEPDDDPPPLAVVDASDLTAETTEDTPVEVTLTAVGPAGVVLSFSVVSGPDFGSVGAVTSTGDTTASVLYTPPADFTGVASFGFQACGDIDGSGDTGQAGECDTATVSVVVAALEGFPPPTAPDFSVLTTKDTPITLDLGSGNTPGDDPADVPRSMPPGSRSAAALSFGGRANGARPAGDALKQQTAAANVPLVVGAGWSATTNVPPAFFWSGAAPVAATDGPFTFTLGFGGGCVSVTDDFLAGDRFRLFDNGELFGTTPRVAFGDVDQEQGPAAAFADPAYSSSTFVLGAGSHSISIEIIESPVSGGRGYIRADEASSAFCTGGNVYTVESLPQGGTLTDTSGQPITTGVALTDLAVTYTPNSGFVGTDSFTYSITDQFGQTSFATVTINVIDPGVLGCTSCVTLTVETTGAGTVSSNPAAILCGTECTAEVTPGSVVLLLARPDDALSPFTGWGGDCSGTSPIITVTMDSDKTCTATFGGN